MNMFWNQYDTISLLPPHMDRVREYTILFLDFRFVVFLPLLFWRCCFNKKRQPA